MQRTQEVGPCTDPTGGITWVEGHSYWTHEFPHFPVFVSHNFLYFHLFHVSFPPYIGTRSLLTIYPLTIFQTLKRFPLCVGETNRNLWGKVVDNNNSESLLFEDPTRSVCVQYLQYNIRFRQNKHVLQYIIQVPRVPPGEVTYIMQSM